MAKNICGNCKAFYEFEKNDDDTSSGNCRKKAPQAVVKHYSEDPENEYTIFPLVNSDLWCLEFVKKSKK